jgi:hypothetical protein
MDGCDTGLGWPLASWVNSLNAACYITVPWCCTDTDSFFSVGRWSSEIRWSICKSASPSTDAPVCWLSTSASEGGSIRNYKQQGRYSATSANLSFHVLCFSLSHLPDEVYAFTRGQAKMSSALQIQRGKFFLPLSILGTL